MSIDNNIDTPTILTHLKELEQKGKEATPHAEILQQLIEQFEPLDFEAMANPHNTENFKLSNKHYLVLSIENALKVAEKIVGAYVKITILFICTMVHFGMKLIKKYFKSF